MNSSNRPSARPGALVTGASSGIGAALARELARHGHDVVLSARRVAPMETLAEELRSLGAAATIIAADLSQPGGAAKLIAELGARGIEVETLVNNAGLGAMGAFTRIDATRNAEMLQVNIVALTELTQALLPAMLAKRRGKIMLVASTASFLPCPNMAVYGATKAFVRSFGEALAQELQGSGVTINVLCPGTTATEFFAVAGGTLSGVQMQRMMTADAVAKIAYAGMAGGERVTVAGVMNRILAFAATHTPHFLTLPAAARMMAQD
ncbi:MAG TPA: SDR family oxidoreductase [Stellaceae bacterium]|jgi:short-subunit dehydrogenase|nr:SDR family oxidoreductase [Stellaceae bacterium]